MTIERRTSRVIVLDPQDRVLLLASRLPDSEVDGRRLWAAPGGAVENGETWEQAAQRELREETGIADPVGPCVWHRDHTWHWASRGSWYRSIEHYFLVRVAAHAIDTSGWTPEERDQLITSHWWTVDELTTTTDVIAPRALAVLLPPLIAGLLPVEPVVLTE